MSTTLQSGAKSFEAPDEVRPFAGHGRMEVVHFGDTAIGRGMFEPGWRWSQDVKPIAGTDTCQAHHTLYIVAGRMGVRMEEGSEFELGPGDASVILPGHDAWTIGDEACIAIDTTGVARYAKRD